MTGPSHHMLVRAAWSLVALAAGAAAQGAPSPVAAPAVLARMPDACVAVAYVPDPVAAVDLVREALGEIPATLPEEQRALLGIGLLALPRILGGSPAELADRLGKGGIALGIVPVFEPLTMVAAALPGDMDAAIAWVRTRPELRWRREGDLLLLANTPAGLDRFQPAQPVGTWTARFPAPLPASAAILAEVDLARLRELQGTAASLPVEGFGTALLLPGLTTAASASGSLRLELHGGEELRIEAAVAAPSGFRARDAIACDFLPRPVPVLDGSILLYASLDRSFHALFGGVHGDGAWSRDPAVAGFLAAADLLDGPNSFVDGLLGRLEEPVHLMVFETPPASAGEPVFVLPGLALAARMKDVKVAGVLEQMLGFVNIIANAERGQRNQQPFLIERVAEGQVRGLTSVMTDWRGPGLPPLEFAIQPTVLAHGDLLAVATTQDAARKALAVLQGPNEPEAGDRVVVRGAALAASLDRNLAPLVLARQLDEGESADAAQRFWRTAVTLLRELHGMQWSYGLVEGSLRARLSLRRRR